MTYLLDTNACVSHLRSAGRLGVSRRLASVAPSDVALSAVTKAELIFGAMVSRDVARNLAEVDLFCGRFASYPFDDGAARLYAEIRAVLARAGTPTGPYDTMIAAIARANGLTLVTHNVSEFSRVPGLTIEDWEASPYTDST